MKRFLPCLAAVLAASACSTPAPPASGLAGTQWTIVTIDGQAAVAPDKARLRFDEARLGANVGCNGMGGEYRVEGGRLVTGPLMATRMFCEGPVWGQEQAVSTLLSGAPVLKREGDRLALESGGHRLGARRLP